MAGPSKWATVSDTSHGKLFAVRGVSRENITLKYFPQRLIYRSGDVIES